MDDMKTLIIDSDVCEEEALKDSAENTASLEVRKILIVLKVDYFGYDDMMHRGQMVVDHAVSSDVFDFFSLARACRFPIEKVVPVSSPQYGWNDAVSCRDNNSSGYNYRTIVGTSRLSKHALGRAFDINPRENIYICTDTEGKEIRRIPEDGVYDPTKKGTLTKMHPLVCLMRSRGWVWGGDWKQDEGVVDYQHFEKR